MKLTIDMIESEGLQAYTRLPSQARGSSIMAQMSPKTARVVRSLYHPMRWDAFDDTVESGVGHIRVHIRREVPDGMIAFIHNDAVIGVVTGFSSDLADYVEDGVE